MQDVSGCVAPGGAERRRRGSGQRRDPEHQRNGDAGEKDSEPRLRSADQSHMPRSTYRATLGGGSTAVLDEALARNDASARVRLAKPLPKS